MRPHPKHRLHQVGLALCLSWLLWSPSAHAGGPGGELAIITLAPVVTVLEVGTSLYHSVSWVAVTTSSSGGGKDAQQNAFVVAHQLSLLDALTLDSSGIMTDLAQVYGVPNSSCAAFLLEVRKRRKPLARALSSEHLASHLSNVHDTFKEAARVATSSKGLTL